MLDEIFTHAGQIEPRLASETREMIGRPPPRQHEELRRTIHAARDNDFAIGRHREVPPVPQVVDANRATALDADPAGQRPRLNAEIAPAHRGFEKYTRRAPAPPAHHGHFAALETLGLGAVNVVRPRKARGDARRPNLLVHHIRFGNANFQFTLCAMIWIVAEPALLRFSK